MSSAYSELKESFIEAVEHITHTKTEITEETQRRLFGLFHRASRPAGSDAALKELSKMQPDQRAAVEAVGDLSQEEAMQKYVDLVEQSDESFLFDDDDDANVSSSKDDLPPEMLEKLEAAGFKQSGAGAASSSSGAEEEMDTDVFEAARSGLDLTNFPAPYLASVRDDNGLTLLHHAVDGEQLDTVRSLLAAKASPDAADQDGSTPLHFAALLGSAELVSELLAAGASPTKKDAEGDDAAATARKEGHSELAEQIAAAAATAPAAATVSVPVIDISSFAGGSASERATIADAFDRALCTSGFCSLQGYESLLPEADVQALRTATAEFFAAPSATKQRAYVDGVVGYLGPGAENVGATSGAASALPDPVESLNLPAYQEEGAPWRAEAAATECPWKDAPWLPETPGLREALLKYFDGVTQLMLVLMQLAELALGLPVDYFKPSFATPGTLLRLAWYPPPSSTATEEKTQADETRLRYGAHTDFDGFTILQRAASAGLGDGLEIQSDDGTWLPVHSPPNTLTINIGDLLARWTNDRWRATKHRVAPGTASDAAGRISLVYFTGPAPTTSVSCLPCAKCTERGPPRYEPITAADHVEFKMRQATEAARAEATESVGTLV